MKKHIVMSICVMYIETICNLKGVIFVCNHRPSFLKYYFYDKHIFRVSSISQEIFKCKECGVNIVISRKYVPFIIVFRVLRCIFPLFMPVLLDCFFIYKNNHIIGSERVLLVLLIYLGYFLCEIFLEYLFFNKGERFEIAANPGDDSLS